VEAALSKGGRPPPVALAALALDPLEGAEGAGRAGDPGAAVHGDQIDRAEPTRRGPVGEALLEAEAGAFVPEPVPVDLAPAHSEIDRPAVADVGPVDPRELDAIDRLSDRPRLGERPPVRFPPLGRALRAAGQQGHSGKPGNLHPHVRLLAGFNAPASASLPGGGVLGSKRQMSAIVQRQHSGLRALQT
jgi:hypothetical protein